MAMRPVPQEVPRQEQPEAPQMNAVLAAQTNILALVLNALSDRVMLFLRTIMLPLVVVGAMWWLYDAKLGMELTSNQLYGLGAFGFFSAVIVWIARK